MRRPLVLLAVAFAAGVLADRWLSLPDALWAGLSAGALGLCSLGARRRPRAARGALLAGFALLGGLLHTLRVREGLPPDHLLLRCPPKEAVRVEGVVRSALRPAAEGRLHLVLDATRLDGPAGPAAVSGGVRLTLAGPPPEVPLPGDRVAFRARVRAPRWFSVPGAPDRRARLARKGIEAVAWLDDPAGLVVLARGRGLSPARAIAARVAAVRGVLDAAGPDEPDGRALLGALALGEAAALPRALRRAFDDTGTSHLLAVSGLHLGLVVAACFLLLRWLLSRSETLLLRLDLQRWTALSTLPVAWGYAALTGASTPTVRAAIVATCVLGGLALGRRGDTPSALALAALILLVDRPDALLDPSFQLSFVAVIAVVAGTPLLLQAFERPTLEPRQARRRWLHAPASLLCASLAASLATAPIVAVHFQRAAPLGPLANLVLVPAVAVGLVPLALAVAVLAPWPALAGPVAELAVTLAGWVAELARGLASVPLGAGPVPAPTGLEIGLWYAVLVAAWAFGRGARRAAIVAVAAAGLLVADLALSAAFDAPHGHLEATFLDVGQGDAAVLRCGGQTVLVDVGGAPPGAPDPGELAVVPALLHARVRRLDLVVLSHLDRDHCGGLAAVLETFPVGEVWTNGDDGEPGCMAALDRARAAGVPVRAVGSAEPPRPLGRGAMHVLWPPPGQAAGSRNDRSLVLRVEQGGTRLLLTGDIGVEVEAELLRRLGPRRLEAAVLKVPHHGSRTSSRAELVAAVAAGVAVVSVGRHNRFGLPDEEVLARYAAQGTQVLRTDRDGTVVVRLDSDGVRLSSPGR